MKTKREISTKLSEIYRKKRKSLLFIAPYLKQKQLKVTTDFNSQLFDNDNASDFSQIVNSIKISNSKQDNSEDGRSMIKFPQEIEANRSIKINKFTVDKIKQLSRERVKRLLRHSTEHSLNLTPKNHKLEDQPKKKLITEYINQSQYDQNVHNPQKNHKILPQICISRVKHENLDQAKYTGRLKPWETKIDLFNETLKQFIQKGKLGLSLRKY